MAVDLCSSSDLKIDGEKLYWDGTLNDLKEFVSNRLKLSGRWTSPGGEVKLFTSDTGCLKWHGKSTKWITFPGDSIETSNLSKLLRAMCKEAVEITGNDSDKVQGVPINGDIPEVEEVTTVKDNGAGYSTKVLNEYAYSSTINDEEVNTGNKQVLREATTSYAEECLGMLNIEFANDTVKRKSVEDRLNEINHRIMNVESKLLDKVNYVMHELYELKSQTKNSAYEQRISMLQEMNCKLEKENETLTQRLMASTCAVSDLNTQIKSLENDKMSLITSIKLIQIQDESFNTNACTGTKTAGTSDNTETNKLVEPVHVLSTDDESINNEANFKGNNKPRKKHTKAAVKSTTNQTGIAKSTEKQSTEDLPSKTSQSTTKTCGELNSDKSKKKSQASKSDKQNITNKHSTCNTLEDNQSPSLSKKVTVIAGDSILKHLEGWRLSNSSTRVIVKSFSGATTSDMEDYLKPILRKEPNKIILHAGTNDITHLTAQRVAEGVLNLGIQVNQDSPSTELVISGILPRTDKPDLMLKVNEANKIVKSFCLENNWAFIDHKSFNSTCLNTRGLHLNRKGTSIIASNISNYINAD